MRFVSIIFIIILIVFLYTIYFSDISLAPSYIRKPLLNFVWCKEEESICFYIADDGTILEEAPSSKGPLLSLIKSQNPPSGELLNYFSDLRDQFESKAKVKIKEINLDDVIKIMTDEGWQIIFERSSSAEKLSFLLTNILDKEIKDKRKNLEYIDLRLENRAYYKLK